MRVEELRIGNYLNIEGSIVKVSSILQNTFHCSKNGIEYGDYNHNFQPIQLTNQWLMNFGAIEYLGSSRTFKYSRFELLWREEYNYWYVTDFEDETYMTKIEFVHEFQNFIFAMDQEELKVKTTSSTSQ